MDRTTHGGERSVQRAAMAAPTATLEAALISARDAARTVSVGSWLTDALRSASPFRLAQPA
jgi:hypothetical protein